MFVKDYPIKIYVQLGDGSMYYSFQIYL